MARPIRAKGRKGANKDHKDCGGGRRGEPGTGTSSAIDRNGTQSGAAGTTEPPGTTTGDGNPPDGPARTAEEAPEALNCAHVTESGADGRPINHVARALRSDPNERKPRRNDALSRLRAHVSTPRSSLSHTDVCFG